MRTTVDLPDDLLREARRRAAEEGTTLTALLADGLRLRLAPAPPRPRSRTRLPVSTLSGGMHPWIDPASNASILDAADDGAVPRCQGRAHGRFAPTISGRPPSANGEEPERVAVAG